MATYPTSLVAQWNTYIARIERLERMLAKVSALERPTRYYNLALALDTERSNSSACADRVRKACALLERLQTQPRGQYATQYVQYTLGLSFDPYRTIGQALALACGSASLSPDQIETLYPQPHENE